MWHTTMCAEEESAPRHQARTGRLMLWHMSRTSRMQAAFMTI